MGRYSKHATYREGERSQREHADSVRKGERGRDILPHDPAGRFWSESEREAQRQESENEAIFQALRIIYGLNIRKED